MDDPKSIFYIIFLILFVLYRIFMARKNPQQKPKQQPGPTPQREQQPQQQKEPQGLDDIFGDLMREIEKEKQKQAQPPEPEPIPEPELIEESLEDKSMFITERERQQLINREGIDSVKEKNEIGAIKGDLTSGDLTKQQRKDAAFDFDPREAYLLKTLLERKYT